MPLLFQRSIGSENRPFTPTAIRKLLIADTNPSTRQWATRPSIPHEAIEARRAFIARRRTTRPSVEFRTPTDQERDAFLAHFEKRKVSVGTCGRAFGSPCIHEHACVRCSLLRPDPAQRPRLEEVRDNLEARIAEAKRVGWLGEVEGLRVSLAGAKDKITQIDAALQRQTSAVTLGMPAFNSLAGRTTSTSPPN